MEINPAYYNLPVSGSDSLQQSEADYGTGSAATGDLSDIIFEFDIDFYNTELLIPFADTMDCTSSVSPSENNESTLPSLPQPNSSVSPTPPFVFPGNFADCESWEDMASCSSSSSSHPSPFSTTISQEAEELQHEEAESFRFNKKQRMSSTIDFRRVYDYNLDPEMAAQAKEMMYRAAVMRPVNLGPELPPEKPKRKNVRFSKDPQAIAARQRRERLGERLRVLQRLVPGGSKMDTATMLDEAAHYLKYLKSQISIMERSASTFPTDQLS